MITVVMILLIQGSLPQVIEYSSEKECVRSLKSMVKTNPRVDKAYCVELK